MSIKAIILIFCVSSASASDADENSPLLNGRNTAFPSNSLLTRAQQTPSQLQKGASFIPQPPVEEKRTPIDLRAVASLPIDLQTFQLHPRQAATLRAREFSSSAPRPDTIETQANAIPRPSNPTSIATQTDKSSSSPRAASTPSSSPRASQHSTRSHHKPSGEATTPLNKRFQRRRSSSATYHPLSPLITADQSSQREQPSTLSDSIEKFANQITNKAKLKEAIKEIITTHASNAEADPEKKQFLKQNADLMNKIVLDADNRRIAKESYWITKHFKKYDYENIKKILKSKSQVIQSIITLINNVKYQE